MWSIGASRRRCHLIEWPIVLRKIFEHRINIVVTKIRSPRNHLVHHLFPFPARSMLRGDHRERMAHCTLFSNDGLPLTIRHRSGVCRGRTRLGGLRLAGWRL